MLLLWGIAKIFIEILFFAGMAGSLLVVVLTLIEDFRLIFVKDKKLESDGYRSAEPTVSQLRALAGEQHETAFR